MATRRSTERSSGLVAEINFLDHKLKPKVRGVTSAAGANYFVTFESSLGRSWAKCNTITMYDGIDRRYSVPEYKAVVLHEWGHAFIGLGDTYVEGTHQCQPDQPISLMCSHLRSGGRILADDRNGLSESLVIWKERLRYKKELTDYFNLLAPTCDIHLHSIRFNHTYDGHFANYRIGSISPSAVLKLGLTRSEIRQRLSNDIKQIAGRHSVSDDCFAKLMDESPPPVTISGWCCPIEGDSSLEKVCISLERPPRWKKFFSQSKSGEVRAFEVDSQQQTYSSRALKKFSLNLRDGHTGEYLPHAVEVVVKTANDRWGIGALNGRGLRHLPAFVAGCER